MAQLQHWIWLTTRKGLTLRGQQLTLSYFGSPLAAYEASPEDIAAVPGLVDREREALAQKDLAYARATLELCSDPRESGSLPVRTKTIPSGSLPLTVHRWCSIIGAPCWTLTSSRWSRWWVPECQRLRFGGCQKDGQPDRRLRRRGGIRRGKGH